MSLKGLFFKEDENSDVTLPEKKEKTPAPKTAPTKVGNGLNLGSLPQPQVTVSNAERDEFVAFLNEVYKNGNFPGPDYQEFMDAIKTMASQPLPENVKFTAIFAGFQVQGVTKARLMKTGMDYIEMIKNKTTSFNKEIDGMLSTDVIEKQKKGQQLLKENEEIEKQLIALTEKKNKNLETANAITNEVNEIVSQLNNKKAAFESAASDFIKNVQDNVEKIRLYLPEPTN